ncbi:hypothetical protein ABDI30_09495 [Paenibacillus cisolokensis]|uniref:hypothetical protein n=1 Tax=Paenibacillus cisolokensis TaxID=1658519 RepID=UPI003D29C96F
MIRFMSAILSAMLLSLGFTVINSPDAAGLLYYYGTFLKGFLVLFFIYVFFAVPVSIYIDAWVMKYGVMWQMFVYFLAGAGMGAVFLLLNVGRIAATGMTLIVLFALAGWIFALFIQLLRLAVRRSRPASQT